MASSSATVRVELTDNSGADRGYDIQIGRGLLGGAAERCASCTALHHVIVITDDNVAALYGQTVHQQFVDAGVASHLLTVPAGEGSKSIEMATRLWQAVLAAGATRQSTIVAVGGGMVGDLAGFIAASFARGLDFIQIPTTLLAQVDSSVGGKVAINLPGAKNMVGFYWQPKLVLADLDALDTLPQREFVSGLAEVIKYGVIADAALFEQLESAAPAILAKDKAVLAQIVARCCQIKADVVGEDERETSGRRAILNYGHTIGHALESFVATANYCTARRSRSACTVRHSWQPSGRWSVRNSCSVNERCWRRSIYRPARLQSIRHRCLPQSAMTRKRMPRECASSCPPSSGECSLWKVSGHRR